MLRLLQYKRQGIIQSIFFFFFDKQIKRMQSPICFHFIFFMIAKNIQKVNKQCTIRKAPLTICVVVIGIKCTIHIQIQVKFE